ncbi:MAG: RNA-binding S4 domain-containing protein [Alphaproteobacteria bacterium]|jgi:ribosome-associated heat shock protein Hsp15
MTGQRLDKWLWCARLTKTRSGAARLIAAGKVRINGDRALKPSRLVHAGDVITAAYLGRLSVVRVAGFAERRGPASVAQTLYDDLTPKDVPAPDRPTLEMRIGKRPTKRDRRRLDAFRDGGF